MLVLMLIFGTVLVVLLMRGCGAGHSHGGGEAPAQEPLIPDQDYSQELRDVMRTTGQRRMGQVIAVEGELAAPAEDVYGRLEAKYAGSPIQPLLQTNEYGAPAVVLAPRRLFALPASRVNAWWNVLLLVATLGTTTWAGALHQGIQLSEDPVRILSGLPYALALMLILGVHEMGHYITARIHKMNVSLPYFIPVPFALGTFGAFIQLRSPSPNRKALFDVGVSGPLAGLVVAVIALFVGFQYSEVTTSQEQADAMAHHGASIGSSVLFAALAKLSIGAELTEGHVLILHPFAFAGWLGLLVTALNLLPVGQLDGGHIADAMFGPRAGAAVSMAGIFALFALGIFVWSGLLFWAFIVYFIAGRKGLPPLNDITTLGAGRMAIGWFAFILLVLILVPVPHSFYENFGIHCPYL